MTAISIGSAVPMDAETWRRHANPWSVYSRFLSLPMLGLAIWSREWIGWWSMAAVAVAAVWIWINPRLFAQPASTNNWASKSVMGEQFWLNRRTAAVPQHHVRFAIVLAGASMIGAVQFTYGLVVLDAWMVSYGLLLSLITKAWFLDRMVWLNENMTAPGFSATPSPTVGE